MRSDAAKTVHLEVRASRPRAGPSHRRPTEGSLSRMGSHGSRGACNFSQCTLGRSGLAWFLLARAVAYAVHFLYLCSPSVGIRA